MALLRKQEGIMYWVSASEEDFNCEILHYEIPPTQEQIDEDYDRLVKSKVPDIIWHDVNCTIQIKFKNEDILRLLEDYPEVGMYRKANNIASYAEDGFVYMYVNYILDAHRALFTQYNALITERT